MTKPYILRSISAKRDVDFKDAPGTRRMRIAPALCALAGLAMAISPLPALAQENVSALNADAYRQTLEETAAHFRWAGTAEAQATADEIAARMESYGYAVQRQKFQFTPEAQGKQTSNETENIIAVKSANVQPTGDILIVSAHYDSKESTVGANDDASGEALLLELARVMQDVDSDTKIRFISFSAEEEGLLGSAAYVESLSDEEKAAIIGDIQIDMIGHYRSNSVHLSTAYGNEERIGQLLSEAAEEITGESWETTRDAASDHASFSFAGIPGVMVAQEHTGEAENHRYIDDLSIINSDKAVETGKVIEAVLRKIASPETPSMLEEARAMAQTQAALPIYADTPILFGVSRQDVAVKLGAIGTFEKDEMSEFGYEQSHYVLNTQWFDWEPLETDFVYRKDTDTLDHVLIRTAPLGLNDDALGDLLTRALGDPEVYDDGSKQWGSSSMAENPSLRQYLIGCVDGEQIIEVISYMHFNVGEDIQCYDLSADAQTVEGDAADVAVLKAVQQVIPQETPYVKHIVSWTDGYSYVLGSCTADEIAQSDSFTVRIDKNDFFTADGDFKDASKFLATAVHEYGHALTLNASQMNLDMLNDTVSCNDPALYRSDSYMKAFYDRFYANDQQRDFYAHPEGFVNEYAGTAGMFEDIAESFMQFVIGNKQTDGSLAAQKINFFYDYPEMTEARNYIRQNFGYSIEVNEN